MLTPIRAKPALAVGVIHPYDIFDVNANAGKARLGGRAIRPYDPLKLAA